ncbi:MAG: hypothetical protein IKX45_08710 [Bacteroidales bacterium]|nr:hypothetical protein [Bacteroidales bacterium]
MKKNIYTTAHPGEYSSPECNVVNLFTEAPIASSGNLQDFANIDAVTRDDFEID